jgi:hypothetical protein
LSSALQTLLVSPLELKSPLAEKPLFRPLQVKHSPHEKVAAHFLPSQLTVSG